MPLRRTRGPTSILDLAASTFARIRATDAQSVCTTNVYVNVYRDAGGPAIASDDSIGAGDTCADVGVRLDAGRYRVVVSGANGVGRPAFRLVVTLD